MSTYIFFIAEQNGGMVSIQRLEDQARAIVMAIDEIDVNANGVEQHGAPVIAEDQANMDDQRHDESNNFSNICLFS